MRVKSHQGASAARSEASCALPGELGARVSSVSERASGGKSVRRPQPSKGRAFACGNLRQVFTLSLPDPPSTRIGKPRDSCSTGFSGPGIVLVLPSRSDVKWGDMISTPASLKAS